MTVIVGGHENGLLDTSLALLNRNDRTGSGDPGHGEQLYVNVSNGNLVIQHQDAFLPSLGDDYQLVRTYNARGRASDSHEHEDARWDFSTAIRLDVRNDGGTQYFEVENGDGSIFDYQLDPSTGLYVSTDGSGAYETIEDLGTSGTIEPSYLLTRSDQTRLLFDKQGRLLKLEDTNGVTVDYVYESDRLVQVLDDQGHVLNYIYQSGQLFQVTDENEGVLVEYRYDSGRLSEVIDRFGHSTKYFYTNDGFLERIVLPEEQVVDGQLETSDRRELSFVYDTINWRGDTQAKAKVVTQITDASGGITTFDYDFSLASPSELGGLGHLFSNGNGHYKHYDDAVDPLAVVEKNKFFVGGTTRVVDALGNSRAYSNDAEYVEWRLANGYYETYDANLAATSPSFQAQVDAIRTGHALSYVSRSDGYISEVVDQQGFSTSYAYDEQGNLLAVTDRNGWGAVNSDSAYNRSVRAELGFVDAGGNGKLAANLTNPEKDALLEAFTSHFEYDSRGNLIRTIDNSDNETTFTYTEFNKISSTTSALGHALAVSDAQQYQDQRVALGYAALVKDMSAADTQALLDLHTTHFAYDGNQNLIERRDAGGDVSRFEYDAFGNLTRRTVFLDANDLTDPARQQITTYAYDGFGNQISSTDGEGYRSFSDYDHFGNLTRFTDANGGETRFTYDADNRLLTVTDPQGHTTVNTYDAVGNRISVTDAGGHTITRLYDRNNHLIATLDPSAMDPADDRLTRFEYDVVGNRTAIIDAEGRRTEYTFNARRELVEVLTDEVADANGNPIRYSATFAYDGGGNTIRTTDNRGFATEIAYTPNNLVRQQTDANGHITRFEFDANGNQVRIVAGMQLPLSKRQVLQFSYDEENQLITRTDAEGNVARFAYDAPGNRVAVVDANGHATEFEYDGNNRLIREIRPEVIDPATGAPVRYTVEHRYDGNGNEIETIDENGRSTRFTFDRDNQLVMVEDANGIKTVFGYDSRHNRTAVMIGVEASADADGHITIADRSEAQATRFIYNEFNQLIAEVDGVGNALGENDAPLYQRLRQELGYAALAADLSAADRQTLGELYTRHFAYDKLGNRISQVDHLSRSTSFAYDALNRLTSTTDALGQVTSFAYDGNGNRVSQTDGEGRVAHFSYDSVNRLTGTVDPLGTVTRRAYDDFGNLVEEARAFGTAEARATTFEYDLNNRLLAQTDPQGDRQSFAYDAVGNRLRVTDGLGNTSQFFYNALNRTVKVLDPLSLETRFEYDGVGNRISVVDARGGVSRFEYDPGNRSIGVTDAEGRQTTFAYDVRGNRIEQRSAAGTAEEEITHFEYDVANNLRRVIDAAGGVTASGYDRVYNRTATTDANGHTTTTEFDALNRVFRVTDAEGQVSEYAYDAVGNRLSQTDALGRVTRLEYDDNDRLIRQIAADGVETHFVFDAVGNRTSITRAAGTPESATDTFVYDRDDRLVAQIDAEGNTTSYAYDANHNRTVVTDANGNATLYTYDADSRVVQIRDPEGVVVQYAYDGNGNRTQVTDGLGFASTTYYNGDNEVTLSVDAQGYATSYAYDGNGNVIAQTLHKQALVLPLDISTQPIPAAGATDQTTLFEYDKLNRVTARIDAEGFRSEYVYDAVGNRLETRQFRDLAGTDIAVTRSYYDDVNRQVARLSAEGYLTAFVYDAVGNSVRRTVFEERAAIPADGLPTAVPGDSGRTTVMEYDAVNRLVRETSPLGVHTDFAYDARGNRTAIVEAAGSTEERRTTFAYDAANRLTETLDALGTVTRLTLDANGNVIERREAYGSADERLSTLVYDGNNRVISQTNAIGVTTAMVYDAGGNLFSRTLAVGLSDERTETFEYDGNNRLLAQVNGEGERTESAYDGAGNRVRLTLAPGLPEERTNTFEFDRDNRLVAGVDGEGVRSEYRYDGAGNKVETIQASGLPGEERHSFYTYDLDNRLTEVTDPMGGVTSYTYDVLGNQTQIVNANGGVQSSTFDALGRLVSSLSAGGVLTVNSYDLRGNTVSTTQSFADGSDSRTTTYGYDLLDRQTVITDPEGFSTTIAYDVFGNQTLVIHGQYLPEPGDLDYNAAKAARAFEQTNEFAYDLADRLLSLTDGEGNVITYSYDALGNRLSMTEAAGSAPRTTLYAYDSAGRLTETVTPEGGISRNSYDATGNRVAEALLQSDDGATEVWSVRRFEYDGNARLTAAIDSYDVRTEFEYDAMGNQTVVRSAAGTADERITRKEYDLNNRVSAEIDGEENRSEFVYDSMGNRTKVTDALGRVARFYFDAGNNLVSILDAEGYINAFSYDSSGNRTGERITMTRHAGPVDDLTPPTPQSSPADRIFTSVYDGNGRIIERLEADGSRTTFGYDAAGNLRSEVKFANTAAPRELLYEYDLNNRLVVFTDVDGTVTTFTYDGANNKTSETITSATDPNARRQTVYAYDLNNRMVREAFDPEGLNLVQTLAFDRLGNVVAKTDANGQVSRTEYDLNNRVVRQIDALGNDTLIGYDAVGNQIAGTDGNGKTTDLVYDNNNRVVQEIAPQVEIYTLEGGVQTVRPTTTRAYDAAGNEIQVTDAGGVTTTRYFDSNNRLVAEINGDNALREWSYNAAGEQTGETLYMTRLASGAHDVAARPAPPSGDVRTTTREYDLAGRMTRIVHPQVEITTLIGADTDNPSVSVATVHPEERVVYDAFGNQIETFDRNGNRTVAWYDAKGRLVAQVDPEGYLTEFDYDAQDNVLEQRLYTRPLDVSTLDPAVRPAQPAGEVYQTNRVYDAAGRLIEEQSPLVEVFDPATLTTTLERVLTRYGYDGDGNQTSRTLAAGSPQEYTEYTYYDALGRQVAVVDGNRAVSLFGYDANGNQTRAERCFNPVAAGVDLGGLDETTNFAVLVGNNSNDQVISRLYDALNRISSETELMGVGSADNLTRSFGYDASGNRTRAADEDGFVQKFSYDANGNLRKSIGPDGSGTVYEYDVAGNQISAFTGQLDSLPAPAVNPRITLGDGLVISYDLPADSNVQSYVIYDTASHAGFKDYAEKSTVQGTWYSQSASVEIPTDGISPGDTLYFRVVTQDAAGSRTWTAEQSVTVPPVLRDLSLEQIGPETLVVSASFGSGTAKAQLYYGSPGATNTSASLADQGDGTFKATLNGLGNAQELSYRIVWEDSAGASFSSVEVPFEAQGEHGGISSVLSQSAVVDGASTFYRAHVDATVPAGLADGLLAVAANWERIDVPEGASGATSVVGVDSGLGFSTYALVLGSETPLEAGTYRVSLSAVGESEDLVLDTFEITVGGAELSGTRHSASWKAAAGDDQLVIVEGVRVPASREDGRVVVAPGFSAPGTLGYSAFYGSSSPEEHSTTVTSGEVTQTQTDNSTTPPTITVSVLGYDLGVAVDLQASEVDQMAGDMRLAWRPAGSGLEFSGQTAFTADGTSFAATLAQQPAGEYDLKVFYLDVAGNEVIVDWLRADTALAATTVSGHSLAVAARETEGRITLGANEVVTVDPGLYTGPLAASLGSLSLAASATGRTGGSARTDGSQSGYFAENRYNALNARIATNSETGLWREFGVDANGNAVATTVNPEGEAITTFTAFDGRNRETARFGVATAVYDEAGERRAVTRTAYDLQDNVVGELDPRNSNTTRTWSALGSQLSETNGLRATTEYRYDRLGRRTAEIDALGNSQYKFYDTVGNLVQQIDGQGNVTTYSYDVFGRRESVTNALGQSITLGYDHRDRLRTMVDGEGNALATSNAQEYQDRRIALGFAALAENLSSADQEALRAEQTTTFEYDGRDNRTQTTDANGSVTSQVWDGLGRVVDNVSYQNGQEIHERSQYDAYGNLAATVDAEGRITTRIHGPFGQLLQEIDPGGRITFYEYNDQGQVVREWSSANSKDIRRTYDDAGRPLEVRDVGTGVTTVYSYDIAGNRMREATTTPNNGHNRVVTYEYDAIGQMVSWADQITGMHTNYEWDAAGNLHRAYTDSRYDPQLENIDLPGVLSAVEADIRAITDSYYQVAAEEGTSLIPTAGSGGHLATDGAGRTVWAMPGGSIFNPGGYIYYPLVDVPRYTGTQQEVIRERAKDLGVNLSRYDQIFDLRHYDDGEGVAYSYWNKNLTEYREVARDLLVEMGLSAKLDEGIIDPDFRYVDHLYAYDANNRVESISQKGAVETEYGYDAAGNRDSYTEGGAITTYKFDANGRVTSAVSGGKTAAAWEYDNAGNVVKFTTYKADGAVDKVTTSKYYENNRNYETVTGSQKTLLSMDTSGRVSRTTTIDGSTTLYYDHSYNSAGLETYIQGRGNKKSGRTINTYDANDKMIRSDKGVGDDQSRPEILTFVYNNDGQILYRFHDTGSSAPTQSEFAYANSNPVGQTSKSNYKTTETLLDTSQYNLVQPLGEDFPSTVVTSFTVRAGDTLQSIAAAVYGNPSLWYVLAEANGIEPGVALKEGQRLEVPNSVRTGSLTADAHRVYDEGEIVGSTLPNLKTAKPKKGCGSFIAIIIVAIIAVVATIVTFGAAAVVAGAVFGAALGSLGTAATLVSFAIAGAIVGAAASIVQQGLFMALGYQESFSWKSVASAAVSGAFSGAAQGVGKLAEAGKFAAETMKYAKVASSALKVASVASKQLIENGKITSWTSLASAAVSGYLETSKAGEIGALAKANKVSAEAIKSGLGTTYALSETLQTINSIQTTVAYITPWVGLAETYVRNDGELTPGDWISAVGDTLSTGVSGAVGDRFGGSGFGARVGNAAVRTGINAAIGGALSLVDRDAALDWAYNSVGNEIGQYIGQEVGSAANGYLLDLAASINERNSAKGPTAAPGGQSPASVSAAAAGTQEAQQTPQLQAPTTTDHLKEEGMGQVEARVVQTGDTLSKIVADAYGKGYDKELILKIATLNGIKDPNLIRPGQEILLPGFEAGILEGVNVDPVTSQNLKGGNIPIASAEEEVSGALIGGQSKPGTENHTAQIRPNVKDTPVVNSTRDKNGRLHDANSGQFTRNDKQLAAAKEKAYDGGLSFKVGDKIDLLEKLFDITEPVDLGPQVMLGGGDDFISAGVQSEILAQASYGLDLSKKGLKGSAALNLAGELSYARGQIENDDLGKMSFDIGTKAEAQGEVRFNLEKGGPSGVKIDVGVEGHLEAIALQFQGSAETKEVEFLFGLFNAKAKLDGEFNVGGVGVSGAAGVKNLKTKPGWRVTFGVGATPLVGGKIKATVDLSVNTERFKDVYHETVNYWKDYYNDLNDKY